MGYKTKNVVMATNRLTDHINDTVKDGIKLPGRFMNELMDELGITVKQLMKQMDIQGDDNVAEFISMLYDDANIPKDISMGFVEVVNTKLQKKHEVSLSVDERIALSSFLVSFNYEERVPSAGDETRGRPQLKTAITDHPNVIIQKAFESYSGFTKPIPEYEEASKRAMYLLSVLTNSGVTGMPKAAFCARAGLRVEAIGEISNAKQYVKESGGYGCIKKFLSTMNDILLEQGKEPLSNEALGMIDDMAAQHNELVKRLGKKSKPGKSAKTINDAAPSHNPEQDKGKR